MIPVSARFIVPDLVAAYKKMAAIAVLYWAT